MSAVCLKIVTLLSVSCAALSASGSSGVVWKKAGDHIAIQCRPDQRVWKSMELIRGLGQELKITHVSSKDRTVDHRYTVKLQTEGEFPDLDFTLSNLTAQDTDSYWCVYSTFGPYGPDRVTGSGSVLLVVTEDKAVRAEQACQSQDQILVLVSVVISIVVLLGFIIGTSLWIIKTKALRLSPQPRRQPNNDVYEEMRCTIRR